VTGDEAIEHIKPLRLADNTESIVTESHDVASRFMEFVDALMFFKTLPRDFPMVPNIGRARKWESAPGNCTLAGLWVSRPYYL